MPGFARRLGLGTGRELLGGLRGGGDGARADAPGVERYSSPIQLTGSDLYLQELDLTVTGITVDGPFRVGVEFQHDGLPSVPGLDAWGAGILTAILFALSPVVLRSRVGR